MNTNLKITTKVVALFFLLFFANNVNAQLQNYEFGFGFHGKKNVGDTAGWHMQQKIYSAAVRGHCSLLDFLINRDGDNRFRIGDYLGGGFGTGFAKEYINPNGEIGGAETRTLKSMWITIDLQFGLQSSYAFNDNLRVGVNAFKELQLGFVIGTDYAENVYAFNFIGGNVTYSNFYLEYNHGLPWDLDKTKDFEDHISRFQFRFFLDKEEGKNIGIRFESGNRDWSGRTDRLTSFELCFGRMF